MNLATGSPVALRMRPDLEVREQWFRGRRFWVLKDPLALEYVKLRDEEYAVLRMLDGRTSLESICERYEQEFAPQQLTPARLQSFIGRLHREGLLLSEAVGQGEQLRLRHERRQRREWWQRLSNVLAIRFRGVDPDPFLDWLYPRVRWIFSAWFQAASLAVAVGALLLVTIQFDQLQARLPDFEAFFQSNNLIWLAVALGLSKVIHEVGHALACRHYGGECHEIGFMLLVFTPCLYCDVSDSWMMRNKWHRIVISGAGIYVEVMLAAVCTYLWWFSQPGLLNTLCLNTMFICSVSTIVFNGNPLLRYDGYYMLSDLIEVPNLWQESRSVVYGWLRRWFTGMETPQDRRAAEPWRWQLAVYGIASVAYRGLVLVTILFFVFEWLRPLRLELLAQAIVLMVLGGMVAMPVFRAAQVVANPAARRQILWRRLAVRGALVAAVLAAVAWIPVPHRVHGPVLVESRDARRVYVTVEGRVAGTVVAGRQVRRGEVVARLTNPELQREVQEIQNARDERRLKLVQLSYRRDPQAQADIPVVKQTLAGFEARLGEKQKQFESLTLRAPVSGTVIAPPRTLEPKLQAGQLADWWGTPLDQQNVGSTLKPDTLLCLVGNPDDCHAVIYIDQSQVEFVAVGQSVRIALDMLPDTILTGRVDDLAKVDLDVVPEALALGDQLPTRRDARGVPRPVETLYQARVTLDSHDQPLLLGARGKARILTVARPLGYRIYRYLSRTFTFEL